MKQAANAKIVYRFDRMVEEQSATKYVNGVQGFSVDRLLKPSHALMLHIIEKYVSYKCAGFIYMIIMLHVELDT